MIYVGILNKRQKSSTKNFEFVTWLKLKRLLWAGAYHSSLFSPVKEASLNIPKIFWQVGLRITKYLAISLMSKLAWAYWVHKGAFNYNMI